MADGTSRPFNGAGNDLMTCDHFTEITRVAGIVPFVKRAKLMT